MKILVWNPRMFGWWEALLLNQEFQVLIAPVILLKDLLHLIFWFSFKEQRRWRSITIAPMSFGLLLGLPVQNLSKAREMGPVLHSKPLGVRKFEKLT